MGALEVTATCERHFWRGRWSWLTIENTFGEVSTTELESHILEEGPQLYQGVTSTEEGTRIGIKDQDDGLQLSLEYCRGWEEAKDGVEVHI